MEVSSIDVFQLEDMQLVANVREYEFILALWLDSQGIVHAFVRGGLAEVTPDIATLLDAAVARLTPEQVGWPTPQ